MKKLSIAFLAMLLFIACQNSGSKESKNVMALEKTIEEEKPSTIIDEGLKPQIISDDDNKKVEPPQVGNINQTKPQIPVTKLNWDKKIIKTASINFEIKDFKKYNAAFRDKVKQVGGYIAQEQQSESEYKIENTLTIKVPVDQFDNAVQLLITDIEKLNEKKISSEDVTTEFVDTRSRLESKKQVRLRYIDLLKQAKNMEDILSVQSEINGIQEEIESASGRIEYLNHSSSFSTINLTFYQILNPAVAEPAKPSFSTKFSTAFKDGWNWIQEVFIIITSIWPLLFAVFGTYLIYRRTRKPKVKAA